MKKVISWALMLAAIGYIIYRITVPVMEANVAGSKLSFTNPVSFRGMKLHILLVNNVCADISLVPVIVLVVISFLFLLWELYSECKRKMNQ